MHIGDTLAGLRREAGLSQGAAAAYLTDSGCPCTQKSISKWERGVNLPNAQQLLLLCRLYGVRDVLHRFLGMEDALSGLNALGRRRVEEYIRLLKGDAAFGEEVPEARKPGRVIPLYDLPVSAGTGQFLDSSDHRLLELPEEAPGERTMPCASAGTAWSPGTRTGRWYTSSGRRLWSPGRWGSSSTGGTPTARCWERPEELPRSSL